MAKLYGNINYILIKQLLKTKKEQKKKKERLKKPNIDSLG